MQELTKKEKQVYDLYQSGKGTSEIARIFKQDDRTIRRYAQHIKLKGWILKPENVSDKIGHVSNKITSHQIQDEDGEWIEKQRWVRESPNQVLLDEFHRTLAESHKNRFRPITPNKKSNGYACVVPFGDPHIGMHAWKEETGSDWDLKHSIETHMGHAVQHIEDAHNPEVIYLLVLGDLLHMDNRKNMTERSGNVLDADTRYIKVVRATTEFIIELIKYAASKTKKVVFSAVQGNHDDHSTPHISESLHYAFMQSKHIEIDRSVKYFRYFEYHKNLIGTTHGHNVKLDKLPGIMSTDMYEAWGRTLFRQWLTGHVHHQKFFEFAGCTVESINPLCSKDAYASEHGYRSRQKMTSMILDRELGEIGRKTTVVV